MIYLPKSKVIYVELTRCIYLNMLILYLYIPHVYISIDIASNDMVTFPCNKCHWISKTTFCRNLEWIFQQIEIEKELRKATKKIFSYWKGWACFYCNYLSSISYSISFNWKVVKLSFRISEHKMLLGHKLG